MGHQQFSKVYKTWTDLELFQLLQNKDDYQEEAVEAATAEMNSRELTEAGLKALHETYDEQQFKKQNTREKKLVRSLEAKKEKLIDDLNPLSEKTTNSHIRLICYATALIIIYNFTVDYKWIPLGLVVTMDSSIILLSMPYLFVPIGIYYFWKAQKFGWSIITIWLVWSVVDLILGYIWELRRSGGFLDRFFPNLGLAHYLILFLIFGGLLFYINTKKITEPFKINSNFQLRIGAIAILFVLLTVLISLF